MKSNLSKRKVVFLYAIKFGKSRLVIKYNHALYMVDIPINGIYIFKYNIKLID